MNKEFSFNIDNKIINVFSKESLINIIEKYHINKYFELKQIHSNIVNIVDENYQGTLDGDAMITNLKNVALVIKTADCIPIILYDNKNHVLAVIHSGWRGTLNSIVKDTVKKMTDIYQIDVDNIKAYLYPSIRKCHFEVDEDVYHEFKIKGKDKYITKENKKYHIDLQNIVIDDLKDCGINTIYDANICTYCNHDKYYSYRYNHTDKRNNLVAMIKE